MHELVGPAACREIDAALRELSSRARRSISAGRDDELHRTRIAAKRLRYTIEFFSSTLGPSHTTALRLLAHLQDRLGRIADAEAFGRFYDELRRKLPKDDPRVAGLEARIEAVEQERGQAIEALHALWHGESFPPYPDMLAASISAALPSASNPA